MLLLFYNHNLLSLHCQVAILLCLSNQSYQDNDFISLAIPIRVKSKIVDAFQIRDRWIEEVALVKTEMANFLRYYSDIRIPTLQKDIALMEAELNSRGLFDMSGLHHPFDN